MVVPASYECDRPTRHGCHQDQRGCLDGMAAAVVRLMKHVINAVVVLEEVREVSERPIQVRKGLAVVYQGCRWIDVALADRIMRRRAVPGNCGRS